MQNPPENDADTNGDETTTAGATEAGSTTADASAGDAADAIPGDRLEAVLATGALSSAARASITGAMKQSKRAGHVAFSVTGPDGWFDLPVSLIREARKVGMCPCPGESHPMMKVTFVEGGNEEVSALLRLVELQASQTASSYDVQGEGTQAPDSFGVYASAAARPWDASHPAAHGAYHPSPFEAYTLAGSSGGCWGQGCNPGPTLPTCRYQWVCRRIPGPPDPTTGRYPQHCGWVQVCNWDVGLW
jgi:hypothetical protein